MYDLCRPYLLVAHFSLFVFFFKHICRDGPHLLEMLIYSQLVLLRTQALNLNLLFNWSKNCVCFQMSARRWSSRSRRWFRRWRTFLGNLCKVTFNCTWMIGNFLMFNKLPSLISKWGCEHVHDQCSLTLVLCRSQFKVLQDLQDLTSHPLAACNSDTCVFTLISAVGFWDFSSRVKQQFVLAFNHTSKNKHGHVSSWSGSVLLITLAWINLWV